MDVKQPPANLDQPSFENDATSFEEFHDIFDALDEGFSYWDEDWRFVTCNSKYIDYVVGHEQEPWKPGISAEEAIRQGYRNGPLQIPEGVSEDDYVQLMLGWVGGEEKELESVRKDGRIIVTRRKPTSRGGVLLTSKDVTEERNSEVKAREMLYDALESLEEGFSLWDADFKLLMCNEKFMEIVAPYRDKPLQAGDAGEAIIAGAYKSGLYAIPEDMSEQEYVNQWLTWARSQAGPVEAHRNDGKINMVSAKPTKLGGVLITAIDVTDKRNTEAKARELLFDAMESLEEGFALWDNDLNFQMCNRKYLDIVMPFREKPFPMGTPAKEINREIFQAGYVVLPDGLSEEDFVDDLFHWSQNCNGPREFHSKDGRSAILNINPTTLGGFLVTALDVTKERNAENKARDMLLDAFEAFEDGLVLCDENMNYIFGNEVWKKTSFGGREELIPQPGDSVVENLIQHVKSGFYAIPNHMTEDDYINWMMGSMAEHGKGVPYQSADGRHFIGSSHLTAFGGALLIVRDVTKQMIAEEELEKQREITHQNEKLSALGELLAGVAHELNNPLSVVFGYAQMLHGKFDDPTVSKRIDMIGQAAERSAKIVKTFLAMARQRPTKIELCSFNEVVQTAIEVSTYGLTANGTNLTVELDESVPLVTGDFDQLAQVFTNLIVNAGHAVEDKRDRGEITISSHYDQNTDHVVIDIRDNGNGIPKEIQSRIFEPFFTTKDVGKGTGVGLAFSHRIIESHGGLLELESSTNAGTKFAVKLRSAKDYETSKNNPPNEIGTKSGKQVLVVDDEADVAQLIHDILVENACHVTVTTSAKEAVRILENQSFDVVLSDFKMPEMNGEQFYNVIKAVAPNYKNKIGFITGDAMSETVRNFFAQSKRPHLEKPIMTHDLLKIVDQLAEQY